VQLWIESTADTVQDELLNPLRPAYADLLAEVTTHLPDIAAEVAADIARPGEDMDALRRQVLPSVTWFIEHLARASELSSDALAALREEGAAAARSGETLPRLLDRYLSAGWVVWGAAARSGVASDVLGALGSALLRAGDAAAASIGDGYSGAERELVARTASARREYLDEVLELPPGDAEAAARIRRRAAQFGLDPNLAYRVVVALAEDRPWRIVAGPPAAGLTAVAVAEREATEALAIAVRAGRTGRFEADDLLLERMLLADETVARAAVAHELGPLMQAPRGGEDLVRTLDAYIASGLNVRRTAQDLGLASRTVAYRLARITDLLGGRLDGPRLLRVATVLQARRLMGRAGLTTPAAPLPPAPRGRSRRRRCGDRET